MQAKPGPLLAGINTPEDLRKMPVRDLVQLSAELRQLIIDEVSCNPGHLGASLGAVELAVALHYSLNTPRDLVVWDVGHQAYAHKILTGRKDVFHTNRKLNGISGFPARHESEYDAFGVGHSSTSISAALGMAVASRLAGDDNQVAAVIGDGAMTGGMAFEALNNAGALHPNMTIILNDNNMAISPNSGAMKEYLIDIATSKTYNRVKDDVWRFLSQVNRAGGPNARDFVQKINNGIKSIVMRQSNMFESLKLRYFGPVDGHDVVYLTNILNDLKKIQGPKVLHILTQKGKGFPSAEKDQTLWHAPGKFDKTTGVIIKGENDTPTPPKYQHVFGKSITELAEKNEKIVAVTPAMTTGSSLDIMMEKFPDRCFDVGIAEQHAVTFSAGMATQGFVPFCAIYSTFAQRAYDQIIHDVAIQNLPVIFCLDRAGFVGQDGVTHHGLYDIPALRTIPNLTIAAPMDEIQFRHMLYSAQIDPSGPVVIRYPRGYGMHVDWEKPFEEIPVGKGRILEEHDEAGVSVLTFGDPGNAVRYAARKLRKKGISINHYDMRFVKPLDGPLLDHISKRTAKIITIEDGSIAGGFGSAVLEYYAENKINLQIQRLGVPDMFIKHGHVNELKEQAGFDINSIVERVESMS
ncbi:MAG TPA: 1-deoxy-D-xylulose-5-phosphate synthase [Bacteroidales bacterium]|nr:1-deoxy-D-xylulose-5-phosphate synthase [Bacteroidales bacterium]